MRKLLIGMMLVALANLALGAQMMSERRTAKYGVQYTLIFALSNDGVMVEDIDLTAAGEVMYTGVTEGSAAVMAEATNHPAEIDTTGGEGGLYSMVVTAAEMSFEQIIVRIREGGGACDDMVIYIDTYGNGSAQHAVDFDAADGRVDVGWVQGITPSSTVIPAAGSISNSSFAITPGAAGGLFIAGTNAATTITSGTATQAALTLNGNTSGAGLYAKGGTTGFGFEAVGGNASGGGAWFHATGGGEGLKLSGSTVALDLVLSNSIVSAVVSSVNPTGSTASLIVLDTNPSTWGDLSRCWCIYTKASTGLSYPGVVTAYNATAGTVKVFPSLPFTPLTADSITIYPSVMGMIRKDLPAPNNMYFDADTNP